MQITRTPDTDRRNYPAGGSAPWPLYPEKPKLPATRVKWERLRIAEDKAISPLEPTRVRAGHAIHYLNTPNDPAAFDVFRGNAHFQRFRPSTGTMSETPSPTPFILSHPLSSVNQHPATDFCEPVPVLNIFSAVNYQPCPRLANGYNQRIDRSFPVALAVEF